MLRWLIERHESWSAKAGEKNALDTKLEFKCPWWANFPVFSHAYMQTRGMLGTHVRVQRPARPRKRW
jgi:hypothetical protein